MLWLSRFRLVGGANLNAPSKPADDSWRIVWVMRAANPVMQVSSILPAFQSLDDVLRLSFMQPS
jgi:hypothetical protein